MLCDRGIANHGVARGASWSQQHATACDGFDLLPRASCWCFGSNFSTYRPHTYIDSISVMVSLH